MRGTSARRPPESADILRIVGELNAHGVDYALIGGAAMALHGFPRMTKDVDLILPRRAANNVKLLAALEALREPLNLDRIPARKSLDGGFSTAAEGDLGIDLLFVAASRTFEQYRKYVIELIVDDVPVKVLDLDGMILSKDTGRPEDVADRERLMRLKRRR
jgi:hypothetical protein